MIINYFPFLPKDIAVMGILAAPEPPRSIVKPKKSLTYGSRPRGSSTANPSSPYKSPLPREVEISPSSENMSLINSPPAQLSSQLSSPPSDPTPLQRITSVTPSMAPTADVEEDMEVEDPRTEGEESEDESEHDDRPIVHSEPLRQIESDTTDL
jgi:hypothetical protein